MTLSPGFAPAVEETFGVLNFSSASGSFENVEIPTINGLPAFITNATATSLILVGATSAPDLAVGVITTPTQDTTGQDITVSYTVDNLGTVGTSAGSWTDSVYLSADGALDASSTLLGRVTHAGDIAGLSSYAEALTASLPGVIDGAYHIIVVADSGLDVPDVNRANNVVVSSTLLAVSTSVLNLSDPVTRKIDDGQQIYYRVNLTAGTDVKITVNYAAALEADLAVSPGTVPTTSTFAQAIIDPMDLQPDLVLAKVQGGATYVLVQGIAGAGSGQTFTIEVSPMQFELDSFTPMQGSDKGQVTLALAGSHFTSGTTVQLQSIGGTILPALSVNFVNSNELTANFDLTNAAVGSYDVQAVQAGETSTAPGSFQVDDGPTGKAEFGIFTTSVIPIGGPIILHVRFGNSGDTDIPMPLMVLEMTNVGGVNPFPLDTIGQGDLTPLMPPGFQGEITLPFDPAIAGAHQVSGFSLAVADVSTDPIDWAAQERRIDPATSQPTLGARSMQI